MPRQRAYDRWLFITTGVLVAAGLFMVGSASSFVALKAGMPPSAFWWKQGVHVALGFIVFGATLRLPYRQLAAGRVVATSVGASLLLLVAVLSMPEVGGAHRWFPIGPFNFQPSEAAKLAIVVFVAYLLAQKDTRVNDPWVLLPCLGVVGTSVVLVVIEPDLGSGVMLSVVAGVMLFAAGLRWRYLAALSAVGAVAFVIGVALEPYRWQRVRTFLDPTAEPLGGGFQLNQSLLAFGRGGLTGTGPGHGTQKAYYLYASHTDFIYSVIGEELGLVGCLVLLALFLVVFWRGLRAALGAPDRFGFYLALGLTHLLVLQAMINMCVCLGMLPTKGMPLPFISYGGSSLVASMAAMGLLLNVSQHSN